MAAAAVAAGAVVKVAFLRDAAEFEGLADVLGDGLLQLVHLLLGIKETAANRVVDEGFAEFFKGGDFGVAQGRAGTLLVLKGLALGHQGFVLALGAVVGHENVNLLAHGADVRLFEEGLAKFAGFLDDRGFFSLSEHNFLCLRQCQRLDSDNCPAYYTTSGRILQEVKTKSGQAGLPAGHPGRGERRIFRPASKIWRAE